MSNDKYQLSQEAIKKANGDVPVISKIRIGTKDFNIATPKDWTENREAHRAYIHGRTHYEEQGKQFKDEDEINSAIAEVGCRHSFKNIYDNDEQLSKDIWRPTVSWFNSGKKYQICFKYDETDAIEYSGELTLNENCSYEFTQENSEDPQDSLIIATIKWDAEAGVFELAGEQRDDTGKLSKNNTVTIKPVVFDLQNSEITTYDKLKKLDSKFIPIDNKTITQNEDGMLQTDLILDTDFRVSRTFGNFEAGSIVQAKGKTITQVIQEAFCGDLNPEILEHPSIGSFKIINAENPQEVYEVGETVSLSYTLVDFNPGKYSYGTLKGNNSNIYIDTDHTTLYINESEETSNFKVPFGPSSTKLKVFYLRNDEDYAITSLGTEPEPQVRITINADTDDLMPDCEITGPEICGTYRYFWGYRQENNEIDFVEDTITRETFQHSSLSGLPDTLNTTKAKQWFFAVPESAGISTVDLINQNSGASTGLVKTRDISIADAGDSTVDYKLFYITNAEADFNTNTYKIKCLGGETS